MKKILTVPSKWSTFRLAPIMAAFVFLFSAVVVQPAHAVAVPDSTQCTKINNLGTTAIANAKAQIPVMEAAFKKTYDNLIATWAREDNARNASYDTMVAGFMARLDAAEARATTPAKKAMLETYKTTVNNALYVYNVKYNASRAQYEEDMAALLREHQKALVNLANGHIANLTNLLNTALTTCNDKKTSALSFLFAVLGAGLDYIGKVLQLDTADVGKAVKIIGVFVTAVAHYVADLVNGVLQAITKLIRDLIDARF